jgi:glycosyltransferase 2 family protein
VKSQWFNALWKVTLGLGLLGYVLYINWNPKLTATGEPGTPGLKNIFDNPVNWLAFGLAVLLSGASLLLTLIRWFILVKAVEIPFKLFDAIRLGLIGFTFNTILPSSVGGDVIKGVALYRSHPERRTLALSTILVDRVIGLWAMFLLVAIIGGYFLAMQDPIVTENRELRLLLRIPFTVVGVTTFFWLAMGLVSQRRLTRIESRLRAIPKVGINLAKIWNAVCIYRQRSLSVYLAIAFCAVSHTGWVLAYHCAALTFQVTPNPADVGTIGEHLMITPTGMALQAFIPTPGGVGGGEAVFGKLYELIKKPATIGVIMCFTIRLISYGLGLIGYLVYLQLQRQENHNLLKENAA